MDENDVVARFFCHPLLHAALLGVAGEILQKQPFLVSQRTVGEVLKLNSGIQPPFNAELLKTLQQYDTLDIIIILENTKVSDLPLVNQLIGIIQKQHPQLNAHFLISPKVIDPTRHVIRICKNDYLTFAIRQYRAVLSSLTRVLPPEDSLSAKSQGTPIELSASALKLLMYLFNGTAIKGSLQGQILSADLQQRLEKQAGSSLPAKVDDILLCFPAARAAKWDDNIDIFIRSLQLLLPEKTVVQALGRQPLALANSWKFALFPSAEAHYFIVVIDKLFYTERLNPLLGFLQQAMINGSHQQRVLTEAPMVVNNDVEMSQWWLYLNMLLQLLANGFFAFVDYVTLAEEDNDEQARPPSS